MINFFDWLKTMGFDKEQTRIQRCNLRGTSNYAIGLNHAGITWAITLRVPVMGRNIVEFEQEKIQAIKTADFLAKILGGGEQISGKTIFYFRGNSALVSSESVYSFFEYQNSLTDLQEIDYISNSDKNQIIIRAEKFPEVIDKDTELDVKKKENIKNYLKEYRGPYFVSRGAPASETLCDNDYISLVWDVTKGLVVMHSKTGLQKLFPQNLVCALFDEFNSCLDAQINIDFSETDRGYTTYSKLLKQYIGREKKRLDVEELPADLKQRIELLVKKEVLLRTNYGKAILKELIGSLEVKVDDWKSYSCFIHNDPHCDNFIVVEYEYRTISSCHDYMDREAINKILHKAVGTFQKYTVEFRQSDNTLFYKNYESADDKKDNVNIIVKDRNYEIHLIDIDEATGIDDNSRQCYLYDLLVYAMSVQNLSAIQCGTIKGRDIIKEYYESWSAIK